MNIAQNISCKLSIYKFIKCIIYYGGWSNYSDNHISTILAIIGIQSGNPMNLVWSSENNSKLVEELEIG